VVFGQAVVFGMVAPLGEVGVEYFVEWQSMERHGQEELRQWLHKAQ
jgi:hypothetical protein